MDFNDVMNRYEYISNEISDFHMKNLVNAFSDNPVQETEQEKYERGNLLLLLTIENIKILAVLKKDNYAEYGEKFEKEYKFYKQRIKWIVGDTKKERYDRILFSRIVFGSYYAYLQERIEAENKCLFKKVSDIDRIVDLIIIYADTYIRKGYSVFANELLNSAVDILPEVRNVKVDDMKELTRMKLSLQKR